MHRVEERVVEQRTDALRQLSRQGDLVEPAGADGSHDTSTRLGRAPRQR